MLQPWFVSLCRFAKTCDRSLQTLNHMHLDSNVCHMDITPGNIMLQSKPVNPWDVVRIIDFGFAKWFNEGAARSCQPASLTMLPLALNVYQTFTFSVTLACCNVLQLCFATPLPMLLLMLLLPPECSCGLPHDTVSLREQCVSASWMEDGNRHLMRQLDDANSLTGPRRRRLLQRHQSQNQRCDP